METLLTQARSSREARVEGIKAEATSKHDLRTNQQRPLAQTVHCAQKAIQEATKQWQNSLPSNEANIQLKVDFEKYENETNEKLNEATPQNLNVQLFPQQNPFNHLKLCPEECW